jgi:hypothetical protein
MLPEAKSEDLLYVSDTRPANVYVFSAGGRKYLGRVQGLVGEPVRLCSDKAGNVFVTEYGGNDYVQEYAHGGTMPVETLDVPGWPVGCSVDPTTGNLAVAIRTVNSDTPGVAIYANAQGSPIVYTNSDFLGIGSCSYDDGGNLFVAGEDTQQRFALAELPSGGSSFIGISLNAKIPSEYMEATQWNDGQLAIGSLTSAKQYSIYRVKISETNGKVISVTQLDAGNDYFSGDTVFYIKGSSAILDAEAQSIFKGRVLFYKYPSSGGPVYGTRKFGSQYLDGITVSVALKYGAI